MINNENELRVAQRRVKPFHSWLLQFRQTCRPVEFEALASGYRLEIERMRAQILDYLLRPAQAPPAKQAA